MSAIPSASTAISGTGLRSRRPANRQGVSQLLDLLLPYGSEQLDRVAFEQALDAIGAREHAGTEFSVQVLSQDFERGVELLADNELHPALPLPPLDIVRQQVAQVVAARNTSPGHLAQHALRAGAVSEGRSESARSHPADGGLATLDDVRSYYHDTFRPDLTTIVVIGNITAQQAQATIEKYFGAWSANGPTPTDRSAAGTAESAGPHRRTRRQSGPG